MAPAAQEDHAGGKRLIRVRYRMRPSGHLQALGAAAAFAAVAAAGLLSSPIAAAAGLLVAAVAGMWWRGACRATRMVAVIDKCAHELEMIPCPTARDAPAQQERRRLLSRLSRWLDRRLW